MFASGIIFPGYLVLTNHARSLKTTALACIVLAWPMFPGTPGHAATEPAPAKQSQIQSVEQNDPLIAWFKQQDSLLDGILLRLSRIESLVNDIHRLIQQMPDPGVPAIPPASVATLVPASPAVAATAPPPPAFDVFELLDNREIQFAGGGLLLLFLLLWARHRRKTRLNIPDAEPSPSAAPAIWPELPSRSPGPEEPLQPETPPVPASAMISPLASTESSGVTRADPQPAQTSPRTMSSGRMGNVKTNDQALELAEIMLAMGLGQGAAKTLTAQIKNEPKPALRNWLKLLDIYRQNGQQDEFERSAEELRLHFNVQPEDWQASSEELRSIENYPHIAVRLTELWGKPSCLDYLANLLGDNRDGARTGFPQAVAEELLLLSAMIKADGSVA